MRNRIVLVLPLVCLLSAPVVADADVVSEWNQIMVNTTRTQNPFAQARFAAITQLAVFEAVNAITHDYQSYLDAISAPATASPEAAVAAAAHAVLTNYFPASAAALDMAFASSLSAIPDGPAKDEGIAVGQAAAAALVARRANDGSGSPIPYVPTSAPGFWQPTPPAFSAAILLHWGRIDPFGILTTAQFRSDPPPPLTSNRYARDYNEVKAVGDVDSAARPADRTDIARFFAATSATQAWNSAAAQACGDRMGTLAQNARVLALINMAISDALVSSLETKYYYQLWRPVTAIRAGDIDSNQRTDTDPGYLPLIPAPAFPSYPSAHASAGGAARVILERLCGHEGHTITLVNPALPGLVVDYTDFRQITSDIDDARIYGGIHFRFDQEAGARQGRDVGRYILKNSLGEKHR
jgi:hypothetical protein